MKEKEELRMYCPRCRTLNASGNIFCTECGAGLLLDVNIKRDKKGRYMTTFYFGPCDTKWDGKKFKRASYSVDMVFEGDPDPKPVLQWFLDKFRKELEAVG